MVERKQKIKDVFEEYELTFYTTRTFYTKPELKKVVYEIPLDREPETLRLSYGFKANEFTNVEDWFHIEMDIPSTPLLSV